MEHRYSETIQFLYSTNLMDMDNPDVMAFLPRFIIPARLHAIRSVNFSWALKSPPSFSSPSRWSRDPEKREKAKRKTHFYRETWEKCWATLSSMEGLVQLRIDLVISRPEEWTVGEFDVVKSVTRPKRFKLLLPELMAEKMQGKIGGENCTVSSMR
jgi:hypothetical protein